MGSEFKYLKKTCANMHDVVALIKGLKSRDEGKLFLTAFRKHIEERIGPVADTSLSRFIQRQYPADSQQLHEFLELPFWEEPKHETVSSRESVGKKVGRKRRGLSEDPRLVRPDESPLPGHETPSDPSQ